ncbi:hypothetical protein PYCC9005_005491 [Savitreella phatthalungensis]
MLSTFLTTVLAAAATGVSAQTAYQRAIPPSRDSWYTAPNGYELTPPGSVLRVRQAPGNFSSYNAAAVYQLLYRTTDSLYNATFAVTTLFVPKTSTGQAFLQYGIPYDTADVDASPSYTLATSPVTDIANGLAKGWYVATADYETKKASFTAGVVSGHATLDSIRAVRSSGFGLLENATVALWGYSGGALASEWATELQVQYAPELNISGAALGGLTPNVTSVLLAVDGSIEAGLIPAGILGLASQYPGALDLLNSTLKQSGPMNATGFFAARNYSLTQSIVAFAGQRITDYFVNGIMELYLPQLMRITNRDGMMGYHGTPDTQLYVYKGTADEVSPVADTDNLVNRYCANGANILYDRNANATHVNEATYGAPAAVQFLTNIFAGNYSQTGCTIRNVTVRA